jgi:hypothetical protein
MDSRYQPDEDRVTSPTDGYKIGQALRFIRSQGLGYLTYKNPPVISSRRWNTSSISPRNSSRVIVNVHTPPRNANHRSMEAELVTGTIAAI